jgi:hypothetical protein
MPTLVVQRGHVPRRTGATGGPYEQEVAISVAGLVAAMMPDGWTTRIIDADEPTSRYAGDAFVSLHCDASSNTGVRGASVGWRTTEGRALGAAWKAAYKKAGWPGSFRADNYTAALSGYYGTGKAVSAGNRRAVIVEQGFTTNPIERAWLRSPAGQRSSARAAVWAVTGTDPLGITDLEEQLMETLVRGIQEALKDAGADPGPVDGQWGPRTQAAFTAALKGKQVAAPTSKFLTDVEAELKKVDGRPSSLAHVLVWYRKLDEAWTSLDPGPF